MITFWIRLPFAGHLKIRYEKESGHANYTSRALRFTIYLWKKIMKVTKKPCLSPLVGVVDFWPYHGDITAKIPGLAVS